MKDDKKKSALKKASKLKALDDAATKERDKELKKQSLKNQRRKYISHSDREGDYILEEERLIHYGVKGMWWGVRKESDRVANGESEKL